MAGKMHTKIGFVRSVEDAEKPGKWKNKVTERKYYVDVLTYSRRGDTGDEVIDDFKIKNKLSVVMDPFVKKNFETIAFIEILGVRWKITDAEIAYPRLILTVGGKYNA